MPDAAEAAGRPAPRRALERTPCVGICSTTYGDLVCRGCKRFAHEIVGWNGYQDSQRALVWRRLNDLLAQSVRMHLRVVDVPRLRAAATAARLADPANLPAEVLAFTVLRVRPGPLPALGLAAHDGTGDPAALVTAIDREFYARSRAHYEASFKALT